MAAAPLREYQVSLLAYLVENGDMRIHLLSYQRGEVRLGPVPLLVVTRGFLGIRGGYTLGWEAIARVLEDVLAIIIHVMTNGEEGEDDLGSG